MAVRRSQQQANPVTMELRLGKVAASWYLLRGSIHLSNRKGSACSWPPRKIQELYLHASQSSNEGVKKIWRLETTKQKKKLVASCVFATKHSMIFCSTPKIWRNGKRHFHLSLHSWSQGNNKAWPEKKCSKLIYVQYLNKVQNSNWKNDRLLINWCYSRNKTSSSELHNLQKHWNGENLHKHS